MKDKSPNWTKNVNRWYMSGGYLYIPFHTSFPFALIPTTLSPPPSSLFTFWFSIQKPLYSTNKREKWSNFPGLLNHFFCPSLVTHSFETVVTYVTTLVWSLTNAYSSYLLVTLLGTHPPSCSDRILILFKNSASSYWLWAFAVVDVTAKFYNVNICKCARIYVYEPFRTCASNTTDCFCIFELISIKCS